MKQLTEQDIEQMAAGDFSPDIKSVNKSVRAKLRLGNLIPAPPAPVPACPRVDLHQHTEQQAWDRLVELIHSGARRGIVITGASGILKVKFQQWARDSVISPYIISITPINNGSFEVIIKIPRNR